MKTRFYSILAGAIAICSAHAQSTYEIPNTSETLDLDLVYDQSGSGHAIVAYDRSGASFLDYQFFDGKEWQAGSAIASDTDSQQLFGIDLEVGDDGTLHASFIQGSTVYYASKAADAPGWTREVILSSPGIASANDLELLQTGITLVSNNPHITYNRRSGDSEVLLHYAFRSGGTWTSEEISGPDFAVFPVISAGRIPSNFFSIGSRGPVVAYYQEGKYFLTERFFSPGIFPNPPSQGWTTPIEISDPAGSSTRPDGLRSELKIRDGILHFLAKSMNPDTGFNNAVYHRWEVTGGLLGGLQKTFEDVDGGLLGGNDSIRQVSMTLAPDGTPHAAFAIQEVDGFWEFGRSQRIAPNEWEALRVLSGGPGSPDSEMNAIAVDPFGRAATITSFANTETNTDQDTQIIRETELGLASSSFPVAGRNPIQEVPGQVLSDQMGNLYFIYQDGNALKYRFINAKTGISETVELDLLFPEGDTQKRVLNFTATIIGASRLIVGVNTSSRPQNAIVETRSRRLILSYVNGKFRAATTLFEDISLLTQAPELAITDDGDAAYLGSFGPGQVPLFIYAINTRGGGASNLGVANLINNIPREYRNVVMDSRDGAFAVLGKLNNELSVHFLDSSGNWSDEIIQGSSETIRGGYDIAIRPGGTSYYVTFATDDSIRLATNVRSVTDPLSGPLPNIIIGGATTESLTQVSVTDSGETHLILQFAPGVFYQSYDGFPKEDNSNRISSSIISLDLRSPVLGTDPFHYPIVIGNDGTLDLPFRRLFRSPLTIDADCDGLPLFMELAFNRDPNVKDTIPLVELSTEVINSDVVPTLVFDRVSGQATATRQGIEVGSFIYHIETSQNLENFNDGFIPFKRTPAAGDPVLGTTRQEVIFENRAPGVFNLPKYFFRIRVQVR